MESIGTEIIRAAREKGLSLRAFSRLSGISEGIVFKLKGRKDVPVELVVKAGAALGVDFLLKYLQAFTVEARESELKELYQTIATQAKLIEVLKQKLNAELGLVAGMN